MNELFDLRRLGLLIRGDAIGWYRSVLIISATLAGLMLISTLPARRAIDPNMDPYFSWFIGMLFIWGLIISSRAFRELHDKTRNEAFLLLPASTLEKTLARLLLVTVCFVLYLLLFTTLASLLTEGVNAMLIGEAGPVFDPSSGPVWLMIGHYMIVQSLFFLGAAWFRKNHFIKTSFTLVAGIIALLVLGLVIAGIVLAPYFDIGSLRLLISERAAYEFYLENRLLLDAAGAVLQAGYFVALPLFCWTVAWLRVRETQASDGV